jgi:cell division septation protein DedD
LGHPVEPVTTSSYSCATTVEIRPISGNIILAIEINAFESRQAKARPMIRKLQSGEYRLYSRKLNPKTGKRRNLGTFKSRAAAEKHERDVQYFKRH